MLAASQPPEHVHEWFDAQSARSFEVDRSDEIQRAAATAMVAIAPADQAIVVTARERLAQREVK